MSTFETILFEIKGAIARITLNRPDALNAYNIKMRDELYAVLGAVQDDTDVKVVTLKGAGEKAFCAGADLSEFLTAPSPMIARHVRWQRDIWGRFLNVPQPVIAALHGYVLGSGIEMALCCDIRIASEETKFGLPEVSLGIIPAAGATQTLPRAIGRAGSLEMLLAGSWITADEALRVKLIDKIVPKDDLLSSVELMASKIASHNTAAIRTIKQTVSRGIDLPLSEGLEMERRLAASLPWDSKQPQMLLNTD